MPWDHDATLRAAENVQRAASRPRADAEPYGLASLSRSVDILERELATGPKTEDDHARIFLVLRDVRWAQRAADPTAIDQLQRLHERVVAVARGPSEEKN